MSLTIEQEQAVKILIDRHHRKETVSILQGCAGSGKSFSLNYLMNYLGYENEQVAFASFTGTAAKILMNQGLNASTIHSLIYKPIIRRGICVGFKLKERSDFVGLRLIVIDEFSMLPQNILTDLLSFKIPVILVGDQYQLPAIGEPNQYINQAHATLTQPMRQALESPILWLANEIRQEKNFSYGIYGKNTDSEQVLIGPYSKLKSEWLREDVKIIVGLNKTRRKINLEIASSSTPLIGHKIIFLKNDWENMITNGTIAEILEITQLTMFRYKLKFKTEEGFIYEDYLADFQQQVKPYHQFFDFAYAITCSKAQGATYNQSGLIFDESYVFREDKYKWLYTALTRYQSGNNIVIIR